MIETEALAGGRREARAADKALSVAAALSAEFHQMHPKAPQQPSGATLDDFFAAVHDLPETRTVTASGRHGFDWPGLHRAIDMSVDWITDLATTKESAR